MARDKNFGPVASKKLYVMIYKQILDKIQDGTYKIGEKLPPERELCVQFEVSRAPIREALSALELNGILGSRQGGGVYVISTQPSAINSSGPNELSQNIAPEDIIEVRTLVEPFIARMAAMRANDEDLEAIEAATKRMEEETSDGVYSPLTDEDFHKLIAQASHNDLLIKIMVDIRDSMKQKMWSLSVTRLLPGLIIVTLTSMSIRLLLSR